MPLVHWVLWVGWQVLCETQRHLRLMPCIETIASGIPNGWNRCSSLAGRKVLHNFDSSRDCFGNDLAVGVTFQNGISIYPKTLAPYQCLWFLPPIPSKEMWMEDFLTCADIKISRWRKGNSVSSKSPILHSISFVCHNIDITRKSLNLSFPLWTWLPLSQIGMDFIANPRLEYDCCIDICVLRETWHRT